MSTSKGPMTEAEALDIELDAIPMLHARQTIDSFKYNQLYPRKSRIERLISRHLGISTSDFVLDEPQDWIQGSFNVCLILDINISHNSRLPRTALVRIPLPIGGGEHCDHDIADEKLRCEAATYLWLRQHCPSIPTPRLLGFGLPGKATFTAIENESFIHRLMWQIRRGLAWFRGERLSPYHAHQRDDLNDIGYLLLEWVNDGKMLSSSWHKHRHDASRRQNLYRDMSRIMLRLAKLPLPRIGSWTLNDDGVISLTNRPLSDLTGFWNKNNIPSGTSRHTTYTSSEPFVHDVLSYQDNRMLYQPNAILSKGDGAFQLSALVSLKALLPHFFGQESRNGPFILSLPDMHQSNIFVDESWNIVSLIDFEFAPVRPIQMSHVPSWLTNRGIDQLEGVDLKEFESHYHDFVETLEHEESLAGFDHSYSQQLRQDWITGRFWYVMALSSLNAFPTIFEQHLQPKFFKNDLEIDDDWTTLLSNLWCEDVEGFLVRKLQDYEQYQKDVRRIFAAARASVCVTNNIATEQSSSGPSALLNLT